MLSPNYLLRVRVAVFVIAAGLLAKMHVTDYLRARVNIGALVDLRKNTAKWSNHSFCEIL